MVTSAINFELNGNDKQFFVSHNLNEFGLNIKDAFINWSARTDEYSINSFCDYVVSKDPVNLKCESIH